MKTRISTTYLIVLLLVCLAPCMALAQPGFGDDVDDVPVDGGLCLLVTTGIGYGAKKLQANKKGRNEQPSI